MEKQQKQVIMSDELSVPIKALLKKMSVMGYSDYTLQQFGNVLDSLIEYSKSHEIQVFSSQYAQRFITEIYGEFYENKHSRHRVNRPIALLLDFIQLGVVIRQKNNKKEFTENYRKLFEGFLISQTERGLSARSIAVIRSRLYRLENFLLDSGINRFGEITRPTVALYIESFIGHSTTTVSSSLRDFGRLSDYAVEYGFHTESFSSTIPHVRNLRRQRLPHVFKSEEIQELLESVDRSNPVGKRDYAMPHTLIYVELYIN